MPIEEHQSQDDASEDENDDPKSRRQEKLESALWISLDCIEQHGANEQNEKKQKGDDHRPGESSKGPFCSLPNRHYFVITIATRRFFCRPSGSSLPSGF